MPTRSGAALPAIAIAAAFALAGCGDRTATEEAAPETAAAQVAPPPISVNRQMVSLIDNESHVLWGAEREGMAPRTDEDWHTLEDHALQIVAASYMLRGGGTGPEDAQWAAQPEWQAQAKAMSAAALAAANAAEARDMAALLDANGKLVDSCLACHERFKPEIPTEGRTHRHEFAT